MITAVMGRPGEGKGVAMSTLGYEMAFPGPLRRWLGARPRPLYATYDLDRSRRLLDQRDILTGAGDGVSWGVRNAVVLVDEMGVEADSRQTLNLDPLLDLAWRLHRKVGVDLFYACQHMRQVDVRCRDLTGEVILVRRVFGRHSTRHLKRRRDQGRSLRLPVWQRPWGFFLSYYRIGDFDPDWELKPGVKAFHRRFLGFDQQVAESYRTDEMVFPLQFAPLIAQFEASADVRLQVPETRVVSCVTQPSSWPGIAGLRVLGTLSPKSGLGKALPEVSGEDDAIRSLLARMNIYAPGEVPEGLVVQDGGLVRSVERVKLRGLVVSASRPSLHELEMVVLVDSVRAHQVVVLSSEWYRADAVTLVGRYLRCDMLVERLGGRVVARVASDPAPVLEGDADVVVRSNER